MEEIILSSMDHKFCCMLQQIHGRQRETNLAMTHFQNLTPKLTLNRVYSPPLLLTVTCIYETLEERKLYTVT
jgi:hypothetical protein